MNEQELEKHKVSMAFKTMRGAELAQVINSYFRKYLKPNAEKSAAVGTIFDGQIPQSLAEILKS